MRTVRLTRSDGTDVWLNIDAIDCISVPAHPMPGQITKIRQQSGDQYVKESIEEVLEKLGIDV